MRKRASTSTDPMPAIIVFVMITYFWHIFITSQFGGSESAIVCFVASIMFIVVSIAAIVVFTVGFLILIRWSGFFVIPVFRQDYDVWIDMSPLHFLCLLFNPHMTVWFDCIFILDYKFATQYDLPRCISRPQKWWVEDMDIILYNWPVFNMCVLCMLFPLIVYPVRPNFCC